jgi:ATP-dependent exoDNAse (exonuclease V) beta subunit
VKSAADAVLDVFKREGIDSAETNRGFMKQLYWYQELTPRDTVEPPTAAFMKNAPDSAKWFAKSKDKYRLQLEGSLEGPLEAFCALFGDRYKEYRTALLIRSQVYGLGIAGELRKAFDEVQREKNVISIDDSNTILKGIIDGSDAPFVYEKLGVRFEDFLLDEFQDTSTIQWENFRPLLLNSEAGGFDNLVVGDVKQSIYRWRGSDWHLLDSGVRADFRLGPEAEKVLDGNYRTCEAIVKFNNAFFP